MVVVIVMGVVVEVVMVLEMKNVLVEKWRWQW